MEKFARKYTNIGADNHPVWKLLPNECEPVEPGPLKLLIFKFKKAYKNIGTSSNPVFQIPRPVCEPEIIIEEEIEKTCPDDFDIETGEHPNLSTNVWRNSTSGENTYLRDTATTTKPWKDVLRELPMIDGTFVYDMPEFQDWIVDNPAYYKYVGNDKHFAWNSGWASPGGSLERDATAIFFYDTAIAFTCDYLSREPEPEPGPTPESIGAEYKAIYDEFDRIINEEYSDVHLDLSGAIPNFAAPYETYPYGSWLYPQLQSWKALHQSTLLDHFGGSMELLDNFITKGHETHNFSFFGLDFNELHMNPFIDSLSNNFGGGASLL